MSTQILSTLPPKISVVIPLLNEADNLQELYSRLKAALEPIQKSYQIIFVDDGSIDSSFEILKQISKRYLQDIDSLFTVNKLLTLEKDSVIKINKKIKIKRSG